MARTTYGSAFDVVDLELVMPHDDCLHHDLDGLVHEVIGQEDKHQLLVALEGQDERIAESMEGARSLATSWPANSEHIGSKLGLWAIEPHIGWEGGGARFEERLVAGPKRAYWLDDDVPQVSGIARQVGHEA